MLNLVFQKCKVVDYRLVDYLFVEYSKMAIKIYFASKKKEEDSIDGGGEIDRLVEKFLVMGKPNSWMGIQPKRWTGSFGLKTGLNPGKGHSNSDQISSYGGSSKTKKRDIIGFINKEKLEEVIRGQDAHETSNFIP